MQARPRIIAECHPAPSGRRTASSTAHGFHEARQRRRSCILVSHPNNSTVNDVLCGGRTIRAFERMHFNESAAWSTRNASAKFGSVSETEARRFIFKASTTSVSHDGERSPDRLAGGQPLLVRCSPLVDRPASPAGTSDKATTVGRGKSNLANTEAVIRRGARRSYLQQAAKTRAE